MATNVNITTPPDFLQSYYAALAQKGADAGNLGFTPYGKDMVAPWTQQQQDAAQMVQNRAVAGSPAMSQAQDWYSNMLAGNNGVGNVNAALGPSSIATPGQISSIAPSYGPGSIQSGGHVTPNSNPYLGMNNPYLNNAINTAQGDVASKVNSQFGPGNAFGSTAHQETLARQLGQIDNSMRMQDYTQQQQLGESDVARNLAAQQFNVGNQNQLNQFNANLGFQNAGIANQMGQVNAGLQGQNIANTTANNQFNANLGFQNAGIQNTANQFNAGLQGQNIGRQQSALAFAPTLAANDYADASALMGLGNQLQGTNQQIANANYQEFLRQQQQPGVSLGYMAAGLAPSAGAFSNQTQTTNQQGNQLAGVAGGALTGGAIGNYFQNPWLGAGLGAVAGGLLAGR